MKLILFDSKKEIHISDKIFNKNFNESLIHQVIVSYSLMSRQGTKSQKNRSNVSGSNKKPWRQKGTGRARSGSTKSPIWRSGGVTFAAKPKKYIHKINKKMFKGALKSIFSELIRQNRIFIFEKFDLKQPKTKLLKNKLNKINLNNVLIIIHKFNKNIYLASRNMYKIDICEPNKINLLKLISFKKIIITKLSIRKFEDILI